MLFKFQNLLRRLRLDPHNYCHIHKNIYKMDKAYLRHIPETEQFQFTFYYKNPALKVDRQFNFCRRLSENVESFLGRVAANVDKIVSKKNKKKQGQSDGVSGVLLSLYLNANEVDKEQSCREIFQPGNNVVLNVLDNSYQVLINSPWVDNVALPSSILANFLVYPSKFETFFTDKQQSDFVWSKSTDKVNWIEIGNGFMHLLCNEDINHHLKLSCKPKNGKLEGPIAEVISECLVQASPGYCPFETRHGFTRDRLEGKQFRAVTYNILADLYCDSDYTREVLHPYCPPYALSIDYRKQLILKEVLGYNADIICLQEVDQRLYQNDLNPIFSHLHYDSNFAVKGGTVAEGLGFFCNNQRFRILESHRVVLSDCIATEPLYADIWEKIAKNSKLSARILERTTTLQTNVVESLEFEEILVVGNIHLYFHPDADHIRLLHSGFAIRYLENCVEELKIKHPGKRISLLFCGDFNSTPECGIFKLYTTGTVPKNFVDYQSNQDEVVDDVELRQKFRLESACGTPKYTNYTTGFADCLDYIFYETSNLEVTQVVPLPSLEEITLHTALPSIVCPSDHIALISDLKWL